MLPSRDVVRLLGHATLIKSLRVILGGGAPLHVLTYLVGSLVVIGRSISIRCGGARSVLSARLFPDDVQYAVFERFLVLAQTVLLPRVVVDVAVEVVSAHAVDEETLACAIVRLLLELQAPAVLHELSKFGRVPAAELLERRFNLLLLNRVVLLVLAATGKTLPG